MKRNTDKIDDILTKNGVNSLKAIKAELKIEKNISLIRFLMSYFIAKINEIDYSVDVNNYNEILRALRFVKPDNNEEMKVIENYVKKAKELIHHKQSELSESPDKIDLLSKLNEKVGTFFIETHFEMMNREKKGKVFTNIDENKLKVIIEDYIFKYKDYGHLNLLVSLYPEICNIKISGKTIIIKILKEYFLKPQERDFLSKVLALFIAKSNFKISDEDKKIVSDLCTQYLCVLEIKDLIFIKELVTTLGIKEEIKQDQKLDLLQVRFGIKRLGFWNNHLSYDHFPVNLTDRVALTIDPAEVLVRDDAFSIHKNPDGTLELGLYITDVSSIKEGSPLDIYAYNHFSTIYVKDNWIPMIPWPLVQRFSLDNGLRRTIAYMFRFTPQFELIDCKIVPAIIRVRDNLSYRETTDILKEKGELQDFLKDASDLAEVLADSIGTISNYHRIKEIVRELGGSLDEIPEKYLDTPGNKIIPAFAIFLNNYLAKMFDKSGLPFIYRINDFESPSNVQEQLRRYHHDKNISDMLRSIQALYKVSSFSSVNIGHKGLGLDAYTQVTNPARLYPSLMIQRMIVDLFVKGISPEEYSRKYVNVKEYADYFTASQQRNNSLTYEYNKLCRESTLEKNR